MLVSAPRAALFAPRAVLLLGATLGALVLASPARGNGFAEPLPPPVGTTTVATADLLVKRPPTTPCAVPLFTNQEFVGFSPVALAYAPPAGCAGPWAKVVLQADFNVTAGRQFDRTAVINVGGANLYFGTTMEPGSATARAWHVERDVTDLTALLGTAQPGEAILYNVVDDTYTGRLFGTANLLFYPKGAGAPVPATPQTVVPLAASLTALSPANPVLSTTVTFPRNVERLYLDLIAQSQASDEFWYTCVPDADTAILQSCGGGSFRDVEIAIDGTPAGTAPIFPWIYTGGISPYMWTPVPGVQTLNFEPSRVDLTPFAGVLDDGLPHTVSLQVFGAQDNFSVTGTLLAWRDAGAQQLSGRVTQNTLVAPVVVTDDSGLVVNGSNASGPVKVTSGRDYKISGVVNTSHGAVRTTVAQSSSFANIQNFQITNTKYSQLIDQQTTARTTVSTVDGTGTAVRSTVASYPLTVNLVQTLSGLNIVLDTTIAQTRSEVTRGRNADGSTYASQYLNAVTPHAKTTINQATGTSKVSGMTSAQHLRVRDTAAGCYDRTITVADNAVTAVTDACVK